MYKYNEKFNEIIKDAQYQREKVNDEIKSKNE